MSENYKVQFISHHGILGQKHGRRRYQNPDGSLTPAGRIRYGKGKPRKSGEKYVTKSGKPVKTWPKDSNSSELDGNPKPRKKSISEMNDEELRDQIARLKLEKEYSTLMREMNPQKEHKARKLLSEVATASVKNIGTQAMTYAMGAAVNKVCKGVFGINYDVVNPKQGQSGPQQQNRPNQGQSGPQQNRR